MANSFYDELVNRKGIDELIKESEKHKTLDVRIANDAELPVLANKTSLKERISEDTTAISNIGKKIGKGIGLAAYWGFNLGLFYPTSARKAYKASENDSIFFFAFISAFFIDSIPFFVCRKIIGGEINPLCLIPLGTHALSGLYEWYCYEKNKLKGGEKKNGK